MFYGGFRGYAALATLGVFGLILIWKGITGDVMTTPLGDNIIPRWMYVIGGLVLLMFPAVFMLVRSEAGRVWLGF